MSEALARQDGMINIGGIFRHPEFELGLAPVAEAQIAPETHAQNGNLVRGLKYAGAILLTSIAAGPLAHAEQAEATTAAPTVTGSELTSSVAVGKSTSTVEALASGQVVIMANMKANGMPKSQVRKLERQGKCKVLDGTEVDIWTQGHAEKGKPYGKDTRTSEFCKVGKDWVRVACSNKSKFKVPKNAVTAPVIWVKDYLKAKMNLTVKATADAEALCKTGNAYAYARGHGEASASETVSVKAGMKVKGKGLRSLAARIYGSLTGEAHAKASAAATVECTDNGGTVVPKDGVPGPGEGTPGNTTPDGTGIGGPGAGGQPGNPSNGEVCVDTTDATTGDKNKYTEGDIVTGHPDQNGYCS
ncbi:MAG: hypothetical protein AAB971_03160 [Patescibacteria group bacterium]